MLSRLQSTSILNALKSTTSSQSTQRGGHQAVLVSGIKSTPPLDWMLRTADSQKNWLDLSSLSFLRPLTIVSTSTSQSVLTCLVQAEQRIAHRDLKPDNILITSDLSTIKLCDFGVAGCYPTISKALSKEICGSRRYHSPEVYHRTEDSYNVFAADYWALGCIAYHLLLGEHFTKSAKYADLKNELLSMYNDLLTLLQISRSRREKYQPRIWEAP